MLFVGRGSAGASGQSLSQCPTALELEQFPGPCVVSAFTLVRWDFAGIGQVMDYGQGLDRKFFQ